jgi:hypothetical protein
MKNKKSVSLKQFIKDFDYDNPEWSRLPEGFPHPDTKGLKREERRIFEGIKMAWVFRKPGALDAINRYMYVNKLTYTMIEFKFVKAAYTLMYSIVLIFLVISAAWYLNIKYSLGMKFLLDVFV